MSLWMDTYTGGQVNLPQPQPGQIRIEDIAHSLANQCRFNGHCRFFYSVAHHSVTVACDVSQLGALDFLGNNSRLQLLALLHDAHEAYTGDVTRPVKSLLPQLGKIQDMIQRAIYADLNIAPPSDDEAATIKKADNRMLAAEAKYLMVSQGKGLQVGESSEGVYWASPILSQHDAEQHFLEMYIRLTNAVAKAENKLSSATSDASAAEFDA